MVIYIYYLLGEVAITPQQYRARSFVCNHFLSRNMLINSDEPIFHAPICVVNFFCSLQSIIFHGMLIVFQTSKQSVFPLKSSLSLCVKFSFCALSLARPRPLAVRLFSSKLSSSYLIQRYCKPRCYYLGTETRRAYVLVSRDKRPRRSRAVTLQRKIRDCSQSTHAQNTSASLHTFLIDAKTLLFAFFPFSNCMK